MKNRILIVDDDLAVRDSLKRILEETDYSVVLCADGQEGAERLAHDKFDLLVLDLDLPKLSGFDLLDIVTARDASLPIIILTGMADQCMPDAVAGADALLEKPPDVAFLIKRIESLLTETPAERSRRRCQAPMPTHSTEMSFGNLITFRGPFHLR